jgi:hypothetical protein
LCLNLGDGYRKKEDHKHKKGFFHLQYPNLKKSQITIPYHCLIAKYQLH